MKHVHFIGICGVAMAPVAKMMHDLGWKVSGSDKAFWPPMSTYLQAVPEIEFYPGFHPEKIGNPDLVVVGNFIGPSNPEFVHIQERNIPYKSYPEILEEYVIKPESIVIAGTYGKSTIASLVAWILETAGMHPSFMSAGLQKNFTDGVRSTSSEWSVVEGDEYPASRWNPISKFFYYHPKYLILTSAEWDHMDVFKTEAEYVAAFKKLVSEMPKDGLIVACKGGKNISEVLEHAACKIVYYQKLVIAEKEGYYVSHIERNKDQTAFSITRSYDQRTFHFTTDLIGSHMIENIISAVVLSSELGFDMNAVAEAVSTYQSVRRRLEVRGKTEKGAVVIDDLAHSPPKALAGIRAIRHWYKEARLFVVFEPNVGNRTPESVDGYDNAFSLAYQLIIPRLSLIKTKTGEQRLDGEGLAACIRRTQSETIYIEDDNALIEHLKQQTHEGDVIAFMGSHGFRGMIEGVLK